MNRRHWIPFASLALVAGLAFTASGPATGGVDEAANVAKSCKAIVDAWNRHDPKAMAAVFGDDGDLINPMGRKATGRAEIEAMFAEEQKGPMRDSHLEVKDEPVRFPTDDVAVSDAEVVITGIYGPDGKQMGPQDVHVTTVWKKSGEEWKAFASRAYMKAPAAPAPTR